jgi:hypothetical protein
MEKHRLSVQMRGNKAHEMVVEAIDSDLAVYQGLLNADDRFEGTVRSVNYLEKV